MVRARPTRRDRSFFLHIYALAFAILPCSIALFLARPRSTTFLWLLRFVLVVCAYRLGSVEYILSTLFHFTSSTLLDSSSCVQHCSLLQSGLSACGVASLRCSMVVSISLVSILAVKQLYAFSRLIPQMKHALNLCLGRM